MEKLGNKIIENFPSTTLFIDDLSEIIAIFIGSCKRIELRAGDYKITDPSELEVLAKKFPSGRFGNIYLQGYEPYIKLDLLTYRVSAYVSEDSPEQIGTIAKCRDIIVRGKKLNLGWPLGATTNISTFVGTWQFLSKEYLIAALLLGVTVVLISASVVYGMRNRVTVHTHTRDSVKTFFQRKKDDIALVGISAVIGGLVTYLITKYLS